MKKLASILLVAVMLVACLAGTAFAAKAGEEVTVSFYTSGNPGFVNYGAQINYDSSALTLVSVTAGEKSAGGSFWGEPSTGIVGYFGAMQDITGDGCLFTATFTVNDGAADGDYSVSASLDTASTANAAVEPVSFGISGGTISVEAEHKCVFGEEWKYDKNGHWHECECGEKSEVEDHDMVDGVCSVCGYEEEVVPTEKPADPEPTKKPVDPSKSPQTGDFTAFVLIAVICAAAVVVIVSSKKSKAQK